MPAKGQKTVQVQCVAMAAGLFHLSGIKIVDAKTKKAYLVEEVPEILVQ